MIQCTGTGDEGAIFLECCLADNIRYGGPYNTITDRRSTPFQDGRVRPHFLDPVARQAKRKGEKYSSRTSAGCSSCENQG